jgi:two-component sensor histidine kinase
MGIKLVPAAGTVWVYSERCWQLGMIVYELVTNVARRAFFEGGDGEVRVELSRA